jgi:hypothetical protein
MTEEQAYQKLAAFMRSQMPVITTRLSTPDRGSYQEVVYKGQTSIIPILESSVVISRTGSFR